MKSLLSLAILVGAASTVCTFATSTTSTTSNNDLSYEIPNHISNDTLSTTSSSPFYKTPPGCDCKTSANDDDDQCNQFDCLCSCDLTAGVCDMNCCCDRECSSDEVSSFSSCLDGSESEGTSSPLVKMCVERPPSLEGVNLQYPFRLSDSPEDKLNGLLCVEKDNSAVKGNYFIDQGYPSASQVLGKGSKQFGFHYYISRDETTSKSKSSGITGYQLGDGIVAYHHDETTTLTNAFGGYLVLPTPDSSGNCIELNTVSFGKSGTNTCTKFTSNLASDCERQFSTSRYISNVFIEKNKGSTNTLESISIAKFTNFSGSIVLADDPEVETQSTIWVESTQTCTNALKQMTYKIRYNHTSIIDISVELETIDIVEDSETSQQLQQTFAVNFIPDELESSYRSQEQNNLITRTKSGNPGYIIGSPTLGAISPSSTTNHSAASSYVVAQRAGFTIMDAGLVGQCGASSPTGSTVGFGKNMIVGCTHDMTRQELKDFCTFSATSEQEQHPMLTSRQVGTDYFVYPKWLETNQDLLGIFGNADPLDRRQWIKIESELDDNPSANFTIKSRSFIEAENRCVGMPSRLRYEILWTYVGNVDKPQAKILSAKKSFEEGPTLQHALSANKKQPFSFSTTVSWTFFEPKYETVKSPPPTLLFSVPHDVFYPFQMNSGGDKRRSLVLVWSSLVAVCTAVL